MNFTKLPQRIPRSKTSSTTSATSSAIPLCYSSTTPPPITLLNTTRIHPNSKKKIFSLAAILNTTEPNQQHRNTYTFTELVTERTDLILPFFRDLLLQCPKNYHMCIVPVLRLEDWYQKSNWKVEWSQKQVEEMLNNATGTTIGKFVVFVFGNDDNETTQAPSFQHNDQDNVCFTDRSGRIVKSDVTFGEICVSKTEFISTSLDAQGRSMYVAVSERANVINMNQLNDMELCDLWTNAVRIANDDGDCECCEPGSLSSIACDPFINIKVNCGTYQNIGHLHLKISIPNVTFYERWRNYKPWRKLITTSPNANIKQSLKTYIEQEEFKMMERNEEDQFWTKDRMMRLSLDCYMWPKATKEEKNLLVTMGQRMGETKTGKTSKINDGWCNTAYHNALERKNFQDAVNHITTQVVNSAWALSKDIVENENLQTSVRSIDSTAQLIARPVPKDIERIHEKVKKKDAFRAIQDLAAIRILSKNISTFSTIFESVVASLQHHRPTTCGEGRTGKCYFVRFVYLQEYKTVVEIQVLHPFAAWVFKVDSETRSYEKRVDFWERRDGLKMSLWDGVEKLIVSDGNDVNLLQSCVKEYHSMCDEIGQAVSKEELDAMVMLLQ